MSEISLYIMAIIYILAGINHFFNPKFYLKMIPSYLPWHKAINFISGLAEIALGIGVLIEPVRNYALIGIILLLICVFPANIEMARAPRFNKIPLWIRMVRLPLQGLLIYWAYFYIRL